MPFKKSLVQALINNLKEMYICITNYEEEEEMETFQKGCPWKCWKQTLMTSGTARSWMRYNLSALPLLWEKELMEDVGHSSHNVLQ